MQGETIQPAKILGYAFNDDFCRYLRGFLQENKAYAKLCTSVDSGIASVTTFDPDGLNRHTIINSVLEFTILYQLQLHLGSYFIDNEIDKKRIVTLSRNQLAAEVLKNRVIDLITKDMKERPAFSSETDSKTGGVVFSAYAPGGGGVVYERLEIELPPKSTIFRNSDGFLVIANPLYDLTIMPQYRGFATTLDDVLLTPSVHDHHSPLLAEVKLHIRIKKTAFVTDESMEMYERLDSFI